MATSNKNITEPEWNMIQNLGAIFKEFRQEAGLTQRQAAMKLGTSQARVPVLEQGQADMMMTTVMRWASIYGYDVEVNFVPKEEETEEVDDNAA